MIDDLITKARAAQHKVSSHSQREINEICLASGWQMYGDTNILSRAEAAVT